MKKPSKELTRKKSFYEIYEIKIPFYIIENLKKEADSIEIPIDRYITLFLKYVFMMNFTKIKKDANIYIKNKKSY